MSQAPARQNTSIGGSGLSYSPRARHSPAQVFPLADYVSTPPQEITRLTTGGGHLGIFMGRQALQTCWQPVFADLAARSMS